MHIYHTNKLQNIQTKDHKNCYLTIQFIILCLEKPNFSNKKIVEKKKNLTYNI